MKFGKSTRLFVFEGGPDREEAAVDPQARLQARNEKLDKGPEAPSSDRPSETSKNKSSSKSTGRTAPVSKKRFAPLKATPEQGDEDAEERLESQLSGARRGPSEASDEEDDGDVSDEERANADLEMVAEYLGREALEGADGEDAFYDRTLGDRTKKKHTETAAEAPDSVESLDAKKRVAKYVIGALQERIAQLDSAVAKDSERRSHIEEDDALEAFMAGMSDTVDEAEELTKKRKLLEKLEDELAAYHRLSARLRSEEGPIQLSILSAKELDRISDQYYNGLLERVAATGGSFTLSSKPLLEGVPSSQPKLPATSAPVASSASPSAIAPAMEPPEPKRAKLSEPAPSASSAVTLPTLADSTHSSTVGPDSAFVMPPPQPPAARGAQRSTGAILDSLSAPNPKKRDREESKTAGDEEEIVWQAPQDQSGDGRTSLNAKFGY